MWPSWISKKKRLYLRLYFDQILINISCIYAMAILSEFGQKTSVFFNEIQQGFDGLHFNIIADTFVIGFYNFSWNLNQKDLMIASICFGFVKSGKKITRETYDAHFIFLWGIHLISWIIFKTKDFLGKSRANKKNAYMCMDPLSLTPLHVV